MRGISAGGRERMEINPQFRVEVIRPPHFGRYDDVPLVVSVMQMKRRVMRTITGMSWAIYNDLERISAIHLL